MRVDCTRSYRDGKVDESAKAILMNCVAGRIRLPLSACPKPLTPSQACDTPVFHRFPSSLEALHFTKPARAKNVCTITYVSCKGPFLRLNPVKHSCALARPLTVFCFKDELDSPVSSLCPFNVLGIVDNSTNEKPKE
jgi:hypothetical protein